MHVNNRTNNVKLCSTAGFTVFELIIVVVVIGIISAIASPAWFGFIERQRLNSAQNQILRAMQQAKSQAILQKVTWQFSLQEANDSVAWAVHPASVNPANAQWNHLDQTIHLDPETTLQQSGGVRQVKFDYNGNVAKPPFGRVTLFSDRGGKIKRCVFVSTLIGTLRTAKEQPKPREGKYCY